MSITRLEFIAGLLSFALVVAIAAPALSHMREQSRRSQCGNNLQQIALAIQEYHDTWMYIPAGAQHRKLPSGHIGWGPSWIVALLPNLDQFKLSQDIERARVDHPDSCYRNQSIARVATGVRLPIFRCAASPIPEMESRIPGDGGPPLLLATPSYVGITGAWGDISTGGPSANFIESRGMASGPREGIISFGGVLLPNEPLPFAKAYDGSAFTVIVSEASAFLGPHSEDQTRIDGSGANSGSWLVGCRSDIRRESLKKDHPQTLGNFGITYNLTTARHALSTGKDPQGKSLPGVHPDKGANNQFVSPHSGGVLFAYLDGHCEFLKKNLSETILKRLATRDDGGGCWEEKQK